MTPHLLRPTDMAGLQKPPAQPRFDRHNILWLAATGDGWKLVRRTADGSTDEPLPARTRIQSLVHEAGGGDYTALDGTIVYADRADQRLYRTDPGGSPPLPLTPPGDPFRYADLDVTPDGTGVYCVREVHRPGAPVVNEIVRISVDEQRPAVVIASGADFYSFPRLSPDGLRLAWTSWNHPDMPWDSTELWVGALAPDGTVPEPRLVAGGCDESVFQPAWDGHGRLHFVTDRTGWWNLARECASGVEPVVTAPAEFAVSQWLLGLSCYAFLDDGRIACVVTSNGRQRLGIVEGGQLSFPPTPWQVFNGPWLSSDGQRIACVAGSWSQPSALHVIDSATWKIDTIFPSSADSPVATQIASEPLNLHVPAEDGRVVPAIYFPARATSAPPPVIVISHGGPTAQIFPEFMPQALFWTIRDFAVVYVNYRGSTGYGRAYRRSLYGHWGVADVADCLTVARHLVEHGLADPARLAIRGLSSGGFTVLNAMATTSLFACAVGIFPVSDPATLAAQTHKFESHYVHNLMGWLDGIPEDRLSLADRVKTISKPLLLLHGTDDKVVPIAQTDRLAAELRAQSVPFTYVRFEREGHGFQRSYEIELDFYARVFTGS
jgi:dipeptidyl aminopeptidase/acylaminoacyl peptidase